MNSSSFGFSFFFQKLFEYVFDVFD